MKRILIAFLSVFLTNVALADNLLHINSNIVGEIVKKHIPPTKQFQALFEYNQIVKERGGITPDEICRVCAAAGWQTDFAHAMTDGAKCDVFVEDLLKNASVKLYEVCGKEKGKSGGNEKCINDFQALTTNMIQATGLAKLYAYHKDKTEKVVCSNTARNETINNTSTIRGGMNAGMAPTTSTNTHYVQCKAIDKNIFYEFKFNNTRGTGDSTNHRNFKTGICSVYGYKLQPATSKDNREKSGWDICENATQNACVMINNGLTKAHSGYVASWGPWKTTLSTGAHGRVNEAGAGYKLDASNLPYCILTANVGTRADGTAYERTAFGLDGRHFLTSDIRTQGNQELHNYIRKYVESTGLKITEFDCAETYVTVQLNGRSDPDDMITCTINGSTVDFFFDNLSEWKSKYVQGAKQALDCMVSGGTFTGKKCIGLGKEQCEVVRAANAMSCPECKQIKWNSETNICELPASASASKLKRGLNYTAIVGGAVVGIVITVGTLGTSSAPTIAILGGVGIETAGSVIELIAQMRIDEKADKFFTQSANCKNQTCAEKLIKDYLRELANQSDSLLDSELTTADEEFARLFDLIPPDAEFYTKIVENGIRGETVDSNKRGTFEKGSWNSDQIWRAVGIGLQIIPTVASVGWKIAKKSDKLVKSTAKLRTKLTAASKHVDEMLGIKKGTSVLNTFEDAANLELLQMTDDGAIIVKNKITGLAEARLPLISVKQTKYRPKTNYIHNVSDNSRIVCFFEDDTGRILYLTGTPSKEEIVRTRRARDILGDSGIVKSVNIIDDDQSVLKQFVSQYQGIEDKPYWFMTEQINPDAVRVKNLNATSLRTSLRGKPITIEEQQEIYNSVKKLNDAGINHGDLANNLFVVRQPNGQLEMWIIDYDPYDASLSQDMNFLESMFNSMREHGLADTSVETVMDFWNGTNYGVGNSLERELTLLEELRDARQAKTGSRLTSAVLDDLSDETKILLEQNGNNIDDTIRQLSEGLKTIKPDVVILSRELALLDELENARQAKIGARMYSGVYADLSDETKILLAQNGNDISRVKQRLNLAAQKLEYKPGNQTLGDFLLSLDLEDVNGGYSTFNQELSKLKKDVVTKQANGEDATQVLIKLRNAASDAVDAKLIEENAVFYKENLIRILASDKDLLKQFNNFDNLSHDAKERLARTLINRHGTNLGVVDDVDVVLVWELPGDPSAIGRCCGVDEKTGKRIIYLAEKNLGKAANGNMADGLIAATSHEYGHFVDKVDVDPNKGVLGSQLADISQNFYGKSSNTTLENYLLYKGKPTEKSSFPIGNVVGDNFSDALRQTVTTGNAPITVFSKIEDFEIKYAVPKEWHTMFFENNGNSYFFIKAKPENITGLSNYFRLKGLRVQTTTEGVRVFEKL